jgi:predicted MFS family arabinose efflux permease
MPDESIAMNARRRMWRRLLVVYGVAVAFGVIVSASMSDATVALAIASFAALTLPMLWFVLFKTPPRTPE